MTVFRQISIGEAQLDAVTVGIEANEDGTFKAAVWWEAVGDVDADEAEFDDVPSALAAAEAARELHGLGQVVVALQDGVEWRPAWGQLQPLGPDLSSDEVFDLAADIEAERDA